MKPRNLLIGNGINRLNNQYSWQDLLDDLIQYIEKRTIINTRDKPFPLLYEEICMRAIKYTNKNENDIKKRISQLTLSLESNPIHKEIMDMEMSNILTTNYDYCLEKVGSNKLYTRTKEIKYSLFRVHNCSEKSIWHIHGEASTPSSLLLGYEHYSAYLQHIRNLLTIDRKQYFKNAIKKNESWVDFFFNDDIYILGLSLDYVEAHLWWLLTYRARLEIENNIQITNRIIYIYPREDYIELTPRLELLENLNVEIIPITRSEGWFEFYKKALGFIQSDHTENTIAI